MENSFAKAEDLAEHIKEYVNNRVASAKINAAEKISKILSTFTALVFSFLIFFMFIVFFSIALAFVFTRLTGEYYWGFLIMAGIYLLLGTLIWVFKEKLIRLPIMNALLQQLFKDEDEDHEAY